MSAVKRYLWRIYFPFLEKKFQLQNKFSRESGVRDQDSSPPLIVSLTSMPSRMDKVYITIETLLRQTFKPNRIQLWLCRDEMSENNLPDSLLRQQERGLEICWIDVSMRAYNKLIPALENNRNSIIVTADDDIIYPSWWLKKLYESWQENPTHIVCYRAKNMIKIDSEKLAPYAKWANTPGKAPTLDIFPTGVGGVLYPPKLLADEVFNKEAFTELSPMNDDIWFKAMSMLKGTMCRRVFLENRKWRSVPGTQVSSLSKHNNQGTPGKRPNDIQLDNVFKRYDLYKMLPVKK